jgi:hypothetical protein
MNHKNILLSSLKEFIKEDKILQFLNNIFGKGITSIINFKSISRFNISEFDLLSNLLINIFFFKLDNKINDMKKNLVCNNINYSYIKYLKVRYKNIYNADINNYSFNINVKYARYLDTFIIGVNGSKIQVNEIKNEINVFLKSKLQLKNVCSYVTDIHNDNVKFLNVIITSGFNFNNNYRILLITPRRLIFKALINTGILNNKGKAIPMKNLLKLNIYSIIFTYVKISLFILNSFSICEDFSNL